MYSLKITAVLAALIATAPLMAQQPSSTQNQQPDTSLTSTPTPQGAPERSNGRHAPNPDKQAKHLAKQLGLTRDQVAKIRPILAGRDQQMLQLRADNTMTQRDRRAKLQTIQQDSKARIEALLTDAQRRQFEQILAARRNRSPKA